MLFFHLFWLTIGLYQKLFKTSASARNSFIKTRLHRLNGGILRVFVKGITMEFISRQGTTCIVKCHYFRLMNCHVEKPLPNSVVHASQTDHLNGLLSLRWAKANLQFTSKLVSCYRFALHY